MQPSVSASTASLAQFVSKVSTNSLSITTDFEPMLLKIQQSPGTMTLDSCLMPFRTPEVIANDVTQQDDALCEQNDHSNDQQD